MSYASKYLGKVVVGGETDYPGRFWGVMCREKLPIDAVELPLTWRCYFRAKRALLTWEAAKCNNQRRDSSSKKKGVGRGHPPWRKRPPGEWQGLTVLGQPAQLLALVRMFAQQG